MILADINAAMLEVGRDRLIDKGAAAILASRRPMPALPFEDNSIDRITIAFGLRNVTTRTWLGQCCACRARRRLLVLSFRNPSPLLRLRSIFVPDFTARAADCAGCDSRYLAESVRKHPDQETPLNMMRSRVWRPLSQHDRWHCRGSSGPYVTQHELAASADWRAPSAHESNHRADADLSSGAGSA